MHTRLDNEVEYRNKIDRNVLLAYHEQPESTTGPPFTRPSISATSTWRGRVVFFFIQVILFLAYT